MKIRRLEPDDIPALAGMVVALAAHHQDEVVADTAALRRDCLGPAPWLEVRVAEDAGRLLGYAAGQRRVQMQFGHRGVDLHHLYVEGAVRGQGLGRALVGALRDWARGEGCAWMSVGTGPGNSAAQAFYLKLGFHPLEIEARRFLLPLAARYPQGGAFPCLPVARREPAGHRERDAGL